MNTNCAICIKPVQDSTNIIVAECGHTFHCLCLMTNVAVGCPHCQASEDDDDEGFTPIFRFRRFLNADAVEDADNDDDADADNDEAEAEEEEQWGAESDSCDEFGSGAGAVEDSDDDDDDDTNRLLQDDAMRGFRLFNNLLDGVDHDDADNNDEDYYNIRCDPDESVADYNRRTGHHYNEDGYDDDGYDVYGNDDWGHNRRGRFHSLRLEPDEVQKRV